MGEIRQANFRIDQDTAEKFRKYCEEQRINQAEGFDKLMKAIFELNRASEVLPDRRAELERFGALTEKMMSAYLLSGSRQSILRAKNTRPIAAHVSE